jgi:hypothetical protein
MLFYFGPWQNLQGNVICLICASLAILQAAFVSSTSVLHLRFFSGGVTVYETNLTQEGDSRIPFNWRPHMWRSLSSAGSVSASQRIIKYCLLPRIAMGQWRFALSTNASRMAFPCAHYYIDESRISIHPTVPAAESIKLILVL